MLEGKTILIGKEPNNGRLLVAVKGDGGYKTAAIGEIGCVPGSVSRCKPAEDIGHCKLTIEQNAVMTLANLKPQNVTYVNETEIMVKRVTEESHVSLGKDRYVINLHTILEVAEKLAAQSHKRPQGQGELKMVKVSIKHLKAIWERYDSTLFNMQIEEQKKSNQQRILSILSPLGMMFFFVPIAWPLRIICILISLGLAVFFYMRGRQVKSYFIVKKRELDRKFMKEYICPNKECGHYMGANPYTVLSQNKKCPYCGCIYSEK